MSEAGVASAEPAARLFSTHSTRLLSHSNLCWSQTRCASPAGILDSLASYRILLLAKAWGGRSQTNGKRIQRRRQHEIQNNDVPHCDDSFICRPCISASTASARQARPLPLI